MVSLNLANSSAPVPVQHQKDVLGRVVVAPVAGGQREEILLQALRILRAQAAVPQLALVGVHPARVAGPGEHVALQLHQVVGHAALGVVVLRLPFRLPGSLRQDSPTLVLPMT